MRFRNATVLAAVLCAALSAPAAHAISVKAGKWKLSFNGNVNAHYIYSQCEKHPNVVVGGLACVANSASSSVSNGLLPAALTVSGSTLQDGYHIGFTFGLYPGISTNDGGSPNLQVGSGNFGHTALGTAGLDVRQAFLTVGNKRFGTIETLNPHQLSNRGFSLTHRYGRGPFLGSYWCAGIGPPGLVGGIIINGAR